MASIIDFYNLAISRVGGNKISTIISIDEGSKEAQQCAIKFPELLRSALRKTPWSFATKTRPLSFLGAGNNTYKYRFMYPTECLFFQGLTTVSINKIPFIVELGDDNNRNILCNEAQAEGTYTAEVTSPSVWDPLFYDALAWDLAAELSLTLSGDISKSEALRNASLVAWGKASELDAREAQEMPSTPSYVLNRRGVK